MNLELSMVLKIKCWNQSKYPEFVSKYLKESVLTVSSDCRLFWKSPSDEKLSCWSLIFYCFSVCVALLPLLFWLFSTYPYLPAPQNHWRCEKFGVAQGRWKACEAFKEICIFVLLDNGLYLWYTLENVWELVLHYPWSWEGLPKREWERDKGYSVQPLNLVFEILTLSPPGTSLFLCKKPCTSPTEKAATQEAALVEHLASGAMHWGYICQLGSQSRMKLKCNCPWEQGRKHHAFVKGCVETSSNKKQKLPVNLIWIEQAWVNFESSPSGEAHMI